MRKGVWGVMVLLIIFDNKGVNVVFNYFKKLYFSDVIFCL